MDSNDLQQDKAETDTLATLPDPINLKRACEQCAHLNVCTVYQKLENKLPTNPKHAMNELVPQTTDHLTGDEIINTFAVNPSKIVGEIKEEIKESILEGKIKNTRKEAYSLMLKIGKKKGLIAKL